MNEDLFLSLLKCVDGRMDRQSSLRHAKCVQLRFSQQCGGIRGETQLLQRRNRGQLPRPVRLSTKRHCEGGESTMKLLRLGLPVWS